MDAPPAPGHAAHHDPVRARIAALRDEEIARHVIARRRGPAAKALRRIRRRPEGVAIPPDLRGRGMPSGVDSPAVGEPGSVAVVVPHKNHPDLLRRVTEGIALTRGHRPRVVIVDNGSDDPGTHRLLADGGHTVVEAPGAFNFPDLCNRGAAAAPDARTLVFLNNDVVIDDPGWLDPLVERASRPGSGPVGCLLVFADGTLQHCGMEIGVDGPFHPHAGEPLDRVPADALAEGPRTGVTAACMAVDHALFLRLGGFDPLLARDYNDIDLCLRAARLGHAPWFTPATRLVHDESRSRGHEVHPDTVGDWLVFRMRWHDLLDPRHTDGSP